jgi:hypothetical protein
MKDRTRGKSCANPKYWVGKSIITKDAFTNWARNHTVFLALYKQWFASDFDTKLTPTVNRMSSQRGYTFDNMEWVTMSQNSSLAGSQRKINNRKMVYDLLGVNV